MVLYCSYFRSVDRQSQDVCVQCMVEILKDLQTDGTSGEFLIYMLQVHTTRLISSKLSGKLVFYGFCY